MGNHSFNIFVSFSISDWKVNFEILNHSPFWEGKRSLFASVNLLWMRKFVSRSQQRLRSRWALFFSSVFCLVNLRARTVSGNICFPFFLHKLTYISRQNWSCEETPRSQNSDKAASFSSLVVKTLLRAYESQQHESLHNKSRCLNIMTSFVHVPSKSSTLRDSCIFKKFLLWNLVKHPVHRLARWI